MKTQPRIFVTALSAGLIGLMGAMASTALYAAPPYHAAPPYQRADRHPGHKPDIVLTSTTGRYCREFQQEVKIGGVKERAYGTACRNPDGSWEVVSTGTP